MTILSIDHVNIVIPVGEEDKARRFYVDLLGFVEIPKPAILAKNGGAWFQAGNVQLHISLDVDFHAANKAHPAFVVDDLDKQLAGIKSAGYEIGLPQPPLEGYKRAHIFDPFGNRIELMEKI